jgi:hypothetical protein
MNKGTMLIAAVSTAGRKSGVKLKYPRKRISMEKIEWQGIMAGVAMGVIGLSLVAGYGSAAKLAGGRESTIRAALEVGDYQAARQFYETKSVMGVTSGQETGTNEWEELIYPERWLKAEISRDEARLTKYPGHRDLLLRLAGWYKLAGEEDKMNKILEEARWLDPNDELVTSWRE